MFNVVCVEQVPLYIFVQKKKCSLEQYQLDASHDDMKLLDYTEILGCVWKFIQTNVLRFPPTTYNITAISQLQVQQICNKNANGK